MAFIAKKLISASGATEEPDDDFNLVTGLYHFDGSNGAQNNTFVDSSSNSFSVTRRGNATQGTFSPFSSEEGKWSVEFPGGSTSTTSRLIYQLSSTTTFAFGTGDFTIEAWVFPRSTLTLPNASFILDFRSGNNVIMYLAYNSSTSSYNLYGWTGNAASGINLNEWNHVAIVRESGSEKGFVNGVEKYSASETSNHGNAGITIGNRYASTWGPFDGFISNVRVVKGTAVYTSNFTPSTSPLTNVTNTVTLGLRSNRFVESVASVTPSPSDSTIKIQPFSPFAPSYAYDAAVNGGSMFSDGTGDGAGIAANTALDVLDNGTFTIDFWFYRTNSLGTYSDYVGIFNGVSSGLLIYQYGTQFQVYINGSTIFNVTHPNLNEWIHVALTRDGTTLRLFLNGVASGTSTASLGTSNQPLSIAADGTGRVGMGGFMSGVRVVKGTAVYTSAFSPPTAPSTAITNTEALFSFTNAAIIDQTGKTNVETVGNAQLDTSVKKFGTASAEFDGTGDFLFLPPQPTLSFPSDFTIEFFFNSDVFQSDFNNLRALVSSGKFYTAGNNGNWILRLSTNARIAWASYDGTGSQVYQEFVMPTMSTGTWYHLAVVRNSGNIQIYLNGTASTSSAVADSKNLIDGATNGIYIGYANLAANNDYDGYIDEFRITQKARYTSNFSPPSEAFPNL